MLALIGSLLATLQGHFPASGTIVCFSGKEHEVQLAEGYKQIKNLVTSIRKWASTSSPEIDPVQINEHCPHCDYEHACRDIAESKNDLTLLDRISPKIARKYHKKGIFTIEQLSFLFRPRRRKKPATNRPPIHKPEIQALAIRSNKIYAHIIPAIKRQPIELFLDIEGIPDQDSYYLIGLLICQGTTEQFYSFWANTPTEESHIWNQLTEITNDFPHAPIYHYGSYESRYTSKMIKRYDTPDDISNRLHNLNEEVYGKIYFPIRSNRLKDITAFLNTKGTTPIISGLDSIAWRYLWEDTRNDLYKQHLITYNYEDCCAVKKLLDELTRIASSSEEALDIDFPDSPKQLTTSIGEELHHEFRRIIRSAHAGYEQAKIKLRADGEKPAKRKPGAQPGHPGFSRKTTKTRRVIQIPPLKECPQCLTPLKETRISLSITIIDLVFSKQGVKRVATKYTSYYGYCPVCFARHAPPEISTIGQPETFGTGLRAWVIYHRIILRLSFRTIVQAFEDQFNETMSTGGAINIIRTAAKYYKNTKQQILSGILCSPFVHVDETKISIRGETQYVWVFTNGRGVYLDITPTREATIVHETLKDYSGILISDFYGGYDAVTCPQQKCLVHLIRDINDDLWKAPFDQEYEHFVLKFKNLITPIFHKIDRSGSKKATLWAFKADVDRFYDETVTKSYTSETAQKYQKRFIRYRSSLFTFLEHDDIPWNNNMAERAIRHLAVQRKISGSFYQNGAHDYLTLLSIAQTCRFQNKSFLHFLLSQTKNPDEFQEKKSRKR